MTVSNKQNSITAYGNDVALLEGKTQPSAIASLTDSSGGTANDTIQDLGAAYAEAEVANNFADVTAKINAILVALRAHGLIAG
jgi:hypothetical protein